MKVILLEWNSYGNRHIEKAFRDKGYEVILAEFDHKLTGEASETQLTRLKNALRSERPDYLFGFNYEPEVSTACQEYLDSGEAAEHFRYISWIYDSPFLDVYSYTVVNPVNRVFHFDGGVAQEFADGGIPTVFHLPLGVGDVGNLDFKGNNKCYQCDISFVGSLYTEPKHRLYDKFAGLPSYEKGYLDGLIRAQQNVYGENIMEGFLSDRILSAMEKCYPTDPNATTAMTPAQIYSEFVLCRQVTSLERSELVTRIGTELQESVSRRLYTNDKTAVFDGWDNLGPVDYYTEMPKVFAASKINLNITLRSIRTGIPLRALDIMNAGGFLLTNYQAEMLEYFVPGEDFDYFTGPDDLLEKLRFYLVNDELREQIAANGARKVHENHSLAGRIEILESV